MMESLNEEKVKEVVAKIASRYGYKVSNLDLMHAAEDTLPGFVTQYRTGQDRNLSVDVFLRDTTTIDVIIKDFGMKIARQYYYDDPSAMKYIELAMTWPLRPLGKKLLERDTKKSFRMMLGDILEQSK